MPDITSKLLAITTGLHNFRHRFVEGPVLLARGFRHKGWSKDVPLYSVNDIECAPWWLHGRVAILFKNFIFAPAVASVKVRSRRVSGHTMPRLRSTAMPAQLNGMEDPNNLPRSNIESPHMFSRRISECLLIGAMDMMIKSSDTILWALDITILSKAAGSRPAFKLALPLFSKEAARPPLAASAEYSHSPRVYNICWSSPSSQYRTRGWY